MPEYSLRPAWPGPDSALLASLFSSPEAVQNPLTPQTGSNARTFLIGLEDGREIAAIDLVSLEGEAWIGMAVSPEHRQRGVGTALLRLLVEEAKAKGLRHLSARFEASNLGARQAFLNAGFRVERQQDGLIQVERSLE